MDLELTRIDYGVIGTTRPNCLKLLPNEYKKQQKIAVGDLDGNLQVFSIKKSEAQIHFQSYVGKTVACVQLGGSQGTQLDKIFIATENVVKAYNKKGKMFLSFDTNMTESIKCMFVTGSDLIVCGNHVYNHYRDCKDMGTYLCGDSIVDVAALCPNNTNRILTVLACSGRVLRILEYCRVRQTVELESIPCLLHVPHHVSGDRILCGFADGKVILFNFGHFVGEVKQQTYIQSVDTPSAVTCIDTYDLTGDGQEELLIGRRDGTVQVFTLPSEDEADFECRELFKACFPESITGIKGGCVHSNGITEIVVVTFAGSIFGLTSQVISVSLTDKEVIKATLGQRNSSNDLKPVTPTEPDLNVNLNLVKPTENYRLASQIISQHSSVTSLLSVNESVSLSKNDASYKLSIEMPIQISEILFQSEACLELLGAENIEAEIIENSIPQKSGFPFSVTARLKNTKNKLSLQFQTVEGQYGNLEAYIVPLLQSNCVQLRAYPIRALSLHMRIHTFDATRPFNSLVLKGPFSQAEIHNWIEQCIPEVPERLSVGDETELYFKNVLIGTILKCKYGRGHADFQSDNLSTISILKDFLTKEATKKRIKLEISLDISESSISHVLKLIEPTILKWLKIKSDHRFLQALLQVDIRSEEDRNCLMPEYRLILDRKLEIEKDFAQAPIILGRFFGVLTDFYIDRFKFKGIFVKDKISELVNLLENYNHTEIHAFFESVKINEANSEIFSNK